MGRRQDSSRGFTLIEASLALTIIALLLVPLLHTLDRAQQRRQHEATMTALHDAKEALLTYAVQHRGCLPLAADYEGGLPDTGRDGSAVGAPVDTGSVRAGSFQRAGDVPWSVLALSGRGLTGQQLRLQYFVASVASGVADGDTCAIRARTGIEIWQSDTAYGIGDVVSASARLYTADAAAVTNIAPPAAPWRLFADGGITAWQAEASYTAGAYVQDGAATYRALDANRAAPPALAPEHWRAIGLPGQASAPAWQPGGAYRRGELVSYDGGLYRAAAATTTASPLTADWADLSLPGRLLQTRLGPVIDAVPGSTLATAQNIAVLIAPSRDANAVFGRSGMRGGNHLDCPADGGCTAWVSLNDSNIDSRAFSLAPAATIRNAASAEAILPISLADYRAALRLAGLPTQIVKW